MKRVNIGIIGLGTVGSGVIKALLGKSSALRNKTGADLRIKYVCDIKKKKLPKITGCRYAKSADRVVNDPEIDILVELIGGIHPAKEIILRAIENGKHVVTANKALLAQNGKEIFRAARKNNAEIFFEAAVAGGIPIIRAMRESLSANRIDTVMGILNGTSNYVLTQMDRQGIDFSQALKEAQRKGFAERRPDLDINGTDAAHKLILLAYLAFGKLMRMKDIHIDGIRGISGHDLEYARDFGYCIKPLAIAKRSGNEIQARVHPTLLPKEHLLSNVRGVFNAVFVRGDLIGDMLFYGRGAGEGPAASAVVSDIAGIAENIKGGLGYSACILPEEPAGLKIKERAEIEGRYYIRFSAIDRPGVLASIAGILGKHKISISTVTQKERRKARIVPIVMLTHEAKEVLLQKALGEIDRLPAIRSKSVAIRVED